MKFNWYLTFDSKFEGPVVLFTMLCIGFLVCRKCRSDLGGILGQPGKPTLCTALHIHHPRFTLYILIFLGLTPKSLFAWPLEILPFMMFLHFDLTHLFTFGTGFLFTKKLLLSTTTGVGRHRLCICSKFCKIRFVFEEELLQIASL